MELVQSVRYAMVLATLPAYRQECINVLDGRFEKDRIRYFVGEAQLDLSVKTGTISPNQRTVKNRGLFGRRVLVQSGCLRTALRARSLIVDLNPRSITAWMLLIIRRALGLRTIAWGHLYPRKGPAANTAGLRQLMAALSNGIIAYSYREGFEASERHSCRVWVAPNAIYSQKQIIPVRRSWPPETPSILYIGRLVPSKRVDLLIAAAGILRSRSVNFRVRIVGDGSCRGALLKQAKDLALGEIVQFEGWIDDYGRLTDMYSTAACAVSPGYAGLSITQSLGFGVPIVVADKEDHAPEIELEQTGAVHFFAAGSVDSFADVLEKMLCNEWNELEDIHLSSWVRERYSAESMAAAIHDALREQEQIHRQ